MTPRPLPANPNGTLVVAKSQTERTAYSRKAKKGEAVRIAPALYIEGATIEPALAIRQHLHAIAAVYWPGAVICGRSALTGGLADGVLYLADPEPSRSTPLKLDGITMTPVRGPGPLPGDMEMPAGLHLSGPARRLIENVDTVGRPAAFRAGTKAVENSLDELVRTRPESLSSILAQVDTIAAHFDPAQVKFVRNGLNALLGLEASSWAPSTGRLAARLAGAPFDARRLAMLEGLTNVLRRRSPRPVFEGPPLDRWTWASFFEAYFSNFIEGTTFEVSEARRIAIDGEVPAERPEDAHDVSATYRLTVDPTDRTRVPASGAELIEILRERHTILMAQRPDKRPGQFKEKRNYGGSYLFVLPDDVEGTLLRGFDIVNELDDPFHRAVTMMLLITECHPFDDGNGRVARLTVNAELSVAGQVRLMIPSIYRSDYIQALKGVSNGLGSGEALTAVLAYAQEWAAAVDWSDFDGAVATLTACNAFADPSDAQSGVRLTFPHRV